MKNSVLVTKTNDFAVDIIQLSDGLIERHEYNIGNQIFRSGTSIGANVAEAQFAQSRADFITKLSIALKEANETRYWLDLLVKSRRITQEEYDKLNSFCDEIRFILISSLKTVKNPPT